MLRPAAWLARGLGAVLESRDPGTTLAPASRHLLGSLPERVEATVTALCAGRRESLKLAQAGASRADAQKAWLETVLQGLSEAVLVCNRNHRIMLCNKAALGLLGCPDRIGLGRDLGDVLALAPICRSLARLQQGGEGGGQAPVSMRFICTAVADARMFQARMALLADPGGGEIGYLVTLSDMADERAVRRFGERVRRALARDLRGMARAAAERLAEGPEEPIPENRRALARLVLDESVRMTDLLDG
jgi:DNA polymerase III subunit epsilon